MRIVIDLDGTICENKVDGETYADVVPKVGAADHLQALRNLGHTIIIYTARHMETCGGDVGKVMAKVGNMTLQWLEEFDIPYDEIYFGKPVGDVYIDDRAVRFESWNTFAVIDYPIISKECKKSHEKPGM